MVARDPLKLYGLSRTFSTLSRAMKSHAPRIRLTQGGSSRKFAGAVPAATSGAEPAASLGRDPANEPASLPANSF